MDEKKYKFVSPAGSEIKIKYSAKLDKDGNVTLVEVGQENIQEFIQSFAEDTSIYVILKRCSMGDTSVLSKVQGMYGDFTDVPKTFRDVLQTVIDGQAMFDKLPVAVKEKFGNSFERWFTNIGTDDWNKAMMKEEVVEEVKDNA